MANAHAVFARLWQEKSDMVRIDAAAIASRSGRSSTTSREYAHAVFAQFCGPKSRMLRMAADARASSRGSGGWKKRGANAHAVFDRL